MKLIKRHLKQARGYTMTELVLSLTLFAIGIVPVYQMLVGGARIQAVATKTYQATLNSQALLQSVVQQIEKDVEEAHQISRGLLSADIKPWLREENNKDPYLLSEFLETNKDQEDPQGFSYEVYIWEIEDDTAQGNPISLLSKTIAEAPELKEKDPREIIKIEMKDPMKKYFINQDALLWSSLGSVNRPVGIGEVSYHQGDTIKVKANGIKCENIKNHKITGDKTLENKARLLHTRHTENLKGDFVVTHTLIIDDLSSRLKEKDILTLSMDLTTFPDDKKTKIIRLENQTQATLIVSVYNEKNLENIEIYPVQTNDGSGNIVVNNKEKLEPGKNFIIGVITKDDHKILSKIVDVYAYDYNKR